MKYIVLVGLACMSLSAMERSARELDISNDMQWVSTGKKDVQSNYFVVDGLELPYNGTSLYIILYVLKDGPAYFYKNDTLKARIKWRPEQQKGSVEMSISGKLRTFNLLLDATGSLLVIENDVQLLALPMNYELQALHSTKRGLRIALGIVGAMIANWQQIQKEQARQDAASSSRGQ